MEWALFFQIVLLIFIGFFLIAGLFWIIVHNEKE